MNKYSPITFFGLLIIPIAFGAVHAQDNNTSKDPFEIMLNQAREQQRQKILQEFTESQKQNEIANAQNTPLSNKGQNTGQENPLNPNQSINKTDANPANASGTPPSAPGPATPTTTIPQASATPTNTQPSGPINIYAPPSTNPPSTGQPPQQPSSPSQKSSNIYG